MPGSFSFPLDGSFATYLGWMIPWGTPVTLLGETPEQVAQAQRELVRIGIDRPAARRDRPARGLGGRAGRWRRCGWPSSATWRPPSPAAHGPVVLDVRRRLEWEESHIAGAVHIPLHELPGRLGEIPPGEVWVHCRTGYRSMVAASMLAARGRRVISVDDDFDNAAAAGLPMERG